MATIWKKNTTNYFVINVSSKDIGPITDWKIYCVDLSNGSIKNETSKVTISEIINPITSPATKKTASSTQAGKKTLTLENNGGASFSKGMRISYESSVGTEYNVIKSISGDILTLSYPLKGNVDVNTNVTEVGNTGNYRVEINLSNTNTTFTEPKEYQFIVKSDSNEIEAVSEIVSISEYSVLTDLGNDIATIKDTLSQLNGSSGSGSGGSSSGAKIFI